MPLSHIVIHALTRFNCPMHTFPLALTSYAWHGHIGTCIQSLNDFPSAHYIFACPNRYNDLLTVFQPFLRSHLRHLPLLVYLIDKSIKEIHLPAYLNDIMEKYKASTRFHSGRSYPIVCTKD